MDQQQGSKPADGPELGESFEAQTASNLGTSFVEHNTTPPEHRKRRHLWIWITLAILLIAAFIVYRSRKEPAAGAAKAPAAGGRGQNGPAAITVAQSKTGNMNIYVDALGTVTPTNTVTIYSQITGRVMAVHYREGQLVHKGDALVEIDPRPYEAALTQALGTLKHDQGVLAEARIDYARYKDAFARNAIARQQVEDQEQTVLQYEGTVQADEGTVESDRVQLSYCHIVAPITGRVGLRLVDPGNTIFSGSSSTLVVITQVQPITVVFNVSEDDLPSVQAQLHGRSELAVDAFDRSNDNRLDIGKLTSLNNQIDTTTGTVKFRASFPNAQSQLYPNQFVNARLHVRTLQNTTLIPSAAVQHNGTASFVYAVKSGPNSSGTVAVQPITVLTSDDTNTAVQGIGPNLTMATSGFDRLEGGTKVQINGSSSGTKNSANAGAQTGTPGK
ncbi:efflux RND transporter periplasmic adaptor subunit [Granulicella sibirica]|uniref:Putative Co/Zn/Cd efflux system membrane fusion protein n=1 Tax=Granulicella sibirica TaxID=2479048 RepID=A0A4Q0SW24_9BACT|nr:efflux RND transporter periplasmic adaptor subunit [Granulicella sibirica]RXH54622.1 putative Co/Zn/Cd efflux system membrane fusion protein [Granulicella sibirica]